MTGGFEGKIALATGGGSGIGRAASLAFAGAGAKVVAVDVDSEGGERTVGLIKETGGEAIFVHADVSQAAEVEAMVGKAVETYGRLDCAFNNAGVLARNARIADCSEGDWDRVLSINLKGVFLCLKYELRQMGRQGKGAIVNTASIYGIVGLGSGVSAYIASKHGVVGLTKAAALEYAQDGIRVNAVCPGHVDTPLTEEFMSNKEKSEKMIAKYPLKRIATPEEIAATVVWLCSDAATFVTGHAMAVDGRYLAQ